MILKLVENGVASRGVDKANYPITRKFLFGVQLDF